jgi:hypothetical protein
MGAGLFIVMLPERLEAERGTKPTDDRDHCRSDGRNLHAPPAWELGQAGIIERADRLGSGLSFRVFCGHQPVL